MEVSNSILSGVLVFGPARGGGQTVYKKNININVTCYAVPFKIGIRLQLKKTLRTLHKCYMFFK